MQMTRLLCILSMFGVCSDLAYAQTALTPAQRGRVAWFKLNCVGCHGDSAKGGMGPNIVGQEYNDVYQAMMLGDAREGGMINFSSVPKRGATVVSDITAYLASIGTASEPKFVVWWTTPPR